MNSILNSKNILDKLTGAHDLSHINRVLENARKLHKVYGGNWKIIEAAVSLHEITKKNPEESKQYLPDFPEQEIKEVIYCIQSHDQYNEDISTIEAKIMQDSDILDMLGATGIARGFMNAGKRELDLSVAKDEYKKKRLAVYDALILPESKKMAEMKIAFTRLFFETIEKELTS